MTGRAHNPLFDRVVRATGLSPIIAPFVVRRVCATSGFMAADMKRADLARVVPKLVEAVALYSDAHATESARERLVALANEED